jgi:hypothetical protein
MKIEVGSVYSTHGRKERPEGKTPLGRPSQKGNDNIKMGLNEVGLGGMDWIDLERTSQLHRKDSAAWSYERLTVFV